MCTLRACGGSPPLVLVLVFHFVWNRVSYLPLHMLGYLTQAARDHCLISCYRSAGITDADSCVQLYGDPHLPIEASLQPDLYLFLKFILTLNFFLLLDLFMCMCMYVCALCHAWCPCRSEECVRYLKTVNELPYGCWEWE